MMLKAVVEELMGGSRKLRIEREQEVEEFRRPVIHRQVETVATQIVVCNFLLLLPPCLPVFAACGILIIWNM